MKIVFVHLDWGIGGAEQLMLQLAMASHQQHDVELLTTRCDADHCFDHLRRNRPHIHGAWIPSSLFFGRFQVVCSTVRLLYLAFVVVRKFRDADLIVTDVLPSHLWVLRYWTDSALLFYCHFPDRLLIRTTADNNPLFRSYRYIMDSIEAVSMDLADTVVVNSKFTQAIVRETFPHLRNRALPVLYPALEDSNITTENQSTRQRLIVSLNRFERKKNLALLIHAARYLRDKIQRMPSIIIAGGYDVRNIENVEHRAELGQLVRHYELTDCISFEHSITDERRQELLTKATAVVYTPDREHFGIVPVEAMAAGTPVVCCRSGGPKETVLDGTTGYLCDPPTDVTFGEALKTLLDDPALVERMGKAAKEHAVTTFGMDRLKSEWKEFVDATVAAGKKRVAQRGGFHMGHGLVYVVEAVFVMSVFLSLTVLLRTVGILEEDESILAGTRKLFGFGDEL